TIESAGRIVAIAQQDVAGQEFGVAITRAILHPVLLDQPVGEVGIAGEQQPSRHLLALIPPRTRADRIVGMRYEQPCGGVVIALLALPPGLVEGEAWIRAQLRR